MSVTLISTGIQFPDATVQTTAASGGLNGTYNAVGSIIMAFNLLNLSDYAANATIAGSNLRPAGIALSGYSLYNSTSGSDGFSTIVYYNSALSGTWRCLGASGYISVGGIASKSVTLWTRIS